MLEHLTIAKASELLASKQITSVELTQSYLDRIAEKNPGLNAYLEVFSAHALDQAKASDERRASGALRSDIDGIPLSLKDNILVEGEHATGGSKILEGYVAPYDATVTKKLKEAGAVILGRVNMDEFAMGGSCERSAYGVTRNPVDLDRVPGGSSGGSAAAVAADLCVASLGSDTGGSIRQPAAFTGIVGFKPSYGSVSRYGLMAMASSLDQIGPMTKTVEDAAMLHQVIRGQDEKDQTTVNTPAFHFEKRTNLHGVKVGIPKQAWGEGMTDGVRQNCGEALNKLKELGAELVEIDLPYIEEALAVYYVLMPCEVSANISRFDGIRFGKRAPGLPLTETYMQSRLQGLGEEVRRRIMIGTYALSKGYYDAYYRKARKVQTLIRRAYREAFAHVDVIVTPTTPSPAFKIGEKLNDPLAMYLEDVYTVGVNVAGLPAVSVPCGKTDGLPVGIQFIGAPQKDDQLLSIAHSYEQAA